MAFRDDREALEAKLRATEARLVDIERERDAARAEADLARREARAAQRAAEEAQSTGMPVAPPSRHPHGPLLAVFLAMTAMALFGGVLAEARSAPGIPPERLLGRVEAVSGATNVTVGSPCTIGLVSVTGAYDCRFHVVCGSEALYGGRNLGYVDCDTHEGRFVSAYDGSGTAEEGDPMMFFDRDASVLEVIEPGAWNVSIRLADERH